MNTNRNGAKAISREEVAENPGVCLDSLDQFLISIEPLRAAGLLKEEGYRLSKPLGENPIQPQTQQSLFLNLIEARSSRSSAAPE